MHKLKTFQKRFPSFGWLLYIDVLLPAVLYLFALAVGNGMALFFHNYGLYIVSTLPNFHSFTGIVGLLIGIASVLVSLIKKRYGDAALCLILVLLVTAFFLFGLNYEILRPLTFSSGIPK